MSVRLRTNWLWNQFLLLSLKLQILRLFRAKSSLTFRQLQSVHSKKCLWHDKNTQLKNFLPLYSVLSNYFIYSRVNASYILHGGTTLVAPSKNWIKAISIHLIKKNHKKNLAYLPDSQQIFSNGYWINTLSYNICHWVGIYGLLQNVRLLLLVNISSKFSTIMYYYETFPHSSSMNTSIGESSKFPMSSISI